ncbi:MAG: protein kinase, partial [Bacteroidota bacterium]
MELVDGGTLRKKLPYRDVNEVLGVALQIGEALHEAHAKGIVHRDVKAENIMLTARGDAKVMDFGLAKLKGSLKLTRSLSTVGTLAYMAPEQIQGGTADTRSDIFSFGVLLYEMLTGKLPFRGEHEAAMMYSILNETPDPIGRILPEASAELVHIINRALEKDPEDRYQNIKDMVIDIRRLRKESSRVSRKNIGIPPSPDASAAIASAGTSDSGPLQVSSTTEELRRSTTVTLKIPTLSTRSTLTWLIPAIVVLVGVAGYFLLGGGETPVGERIPVAVADFNNQTKEEELDGLSGMLITSLEQSRHLSVLTRSRMHDILKFMGKGNVDRIDETLGREISRQAHVGALVVATISKFDKLYVIDMKVLDPEKNEYILTVKEQAEGKSSIPAMIDKLAEQTRLGLKERKSDVEATTQKVADLTTLNMEAYQEYFTGEGLINKLQFEAAAEHFRKAVALDSSFGIAWYRLSYALAWKNNPGTKEAIARALKLIDKVPEKEQYLIRVQDALSREEPQPAIALLKQLVVLYPDDKEANYLLGDYAFHQEDLETARNSLQKVLSMDPQNERAHQHLYWTLASARSLSELQPCAERYLKNVPSPTAYSLLSDSYAEQAQYDSALQVCRAGIEKFPQDFQLKRQLGDIYVVAGQPDAAREQYHQLTRNDRPFSERVEGYHGLRLLAISRGEYRKAMEAVDDLLALESPSSGRSHTGTALMLRAWMKARFLQDTTGARLDFERALTFSDAGALAYHIFTYFYYLHSGQFQKARDVVNAELKVVSSGFIPYINGFEAMNSGNFGTAIEYFRTISYPDPGTQYYTARVLSSMGQFPAALSVLRDLRSNISVFGIAGSFPQFVEVHSLSYHLEGTIYERTNERAKAIKSYEAFLTLWKNADAEIPQLKEAKERLKALRK